MPARPNLIGKHREVDRLDLSSVRTMCSGSAPRSAWSLEEFRRRWNRNVNDLWRQNEGSALIGGPQDVSDLTRRVDHLPWWGRNGCEWPSRMHGVQVKTVDGEGRERTQPGDVGELAFCGPDLFPGYFRRDDLNATAFDRQGYYYTSDRFRIMDPSYPGFFDRKKHIIIRGGFNISMAEVENLALSHPEIADGVAVPDETMAERVWSVCGPARSLAAAHAGAAHRLRAAAGGCQLKAAGGLVAGHGDPAQPGGQGAQARAPRAGPDTRGMSRFRDDAAHGGHPSV